MSDLLVLMVKNVAYPYVHQQLSYHYQGKRTNCHRRIQVEDLIFFGALKALINFLSPVSAVDVIDRDRHYCCYVR